MSDHAEVVPDHGARGAKALSWALGVSYALQVMGILLIEPFRAAIERFLALLEGFGARRSRAMSRAMCPQVTGDVTGDRRTTRRQGPQVPVSPLA